MSLVALTLAACTAKLAPPQPPTMTYASGEECVAQRLAAFLGKLATNEVMTEIRGLAGERSIRTIHPGDAVTMDFTPDRLNVELGENGRIKHLRCG